jgi:hypothetical protein
MKIPATLQEELVQAIAHELKQPGGVKPLWKYPKSRVLAEIRRTIEYLKNPDVPPIGFRSENKQQAKNMFATLTTAEKQLAAAAQSPRFVRCLTLRDEELVPLSMHFAVKKAELTELLTRVTKLKGGCKKVILEPPGFDRRRDYRQTDVAVAGIFLMFNLSTNKPTAGTRYTPYCTIASLLYKAVTGECRCNLHRTCRRVLSMPTFASNKMTASV